jgi:23S rRNA (uracil1939-C5)-methyltransferase
MEFFGRDCGGGTLLGLHHRGRYNRIFDVLDCRLQSQLSNRIFSIPCVVREGRNPGEVMVNLVVSEYPDKGVGDLVRCVLERVPEITTFVVTLHRGKAQAAIGEREFVLKGSGRISEVCRGVEFEISAPSFFQTNTGQAAVLYEQIVALAGDLTGATVLDLYCGTGGISLHLAKRADRVI